MYAMNHGLDRELAANLGALVFSSVVVSIVVHGISVTPLMALYERTKGSGRRPDYHRRDEIRIPAPTDDAPQSAERRRAARRVALGVALACTDLQALAAAGRAMARASSAPSPPSATPSSRPTR